MGHTLVWLPATGPAPREFARENYAYTPVAVSPNGKLIAVPDCWNGPLQLRDPNGQVVQTLLTEGGAQDYLAFSTDGRLVIAARSNRIRLWRTSRSSESVWRELTVPGKAIYGVALTPDGRTLISAGKDQPIRFWELATGTLRQSSTGHSGAVLSLDVSPNGRLLASAGEDGKVLLHSLTPRGEPRTLTDHDRLWEQLARTDAAEAGSAAAMLHGSPHEALELLSSHMRPVQRLDDEQLQGLIHDLNSPRFAVRTQAYKRLEALGSTTAPALRQVLKQQPSLEMRRRIEQLLEAMEEMPLSRDELRVDRSIELLEQFGTPGAVRLLDQLATGAPGARQTEAAQLALKRLRR
jgi:hypothetical protein